MNSTTMTFWSDMQNSNIVYILYLSNTSWDETMMADIDLFNERVNLVMGKVYENRKIISEFQLRTMEPSSESLRELSLTGCDLSIINRIICVIQKMIEENNENADEYRNLKNHVEAKLDNWIKLHDFKYVNNTIAHNR